MGPPLAPLWIGGLLWLLFQRSESGGFRAIGKTAEEAVGVLRHTLELQEAGVIGVEMEVVPTKVAEFITKNVDISLGLGRLRAYPGYQQTREDNPEGVKEPQSTCP